MIKASELRIGNWINFFSNISNEFVCCQASHAIIKIVFDNESRANPIPLTPEILEKAGFQVEYTNGGWLKWQKGEFKLLDRRLPHPQYHAPKAMIIHLHQLQNLYFALTGEELPITL